MATVKAFIRTTRKNSGRVKVRFRLTDGRNMQLFHKSEIETDLDKWDEKRECYKSKILIPESERIRFNKEIADRKNRILTVYNKADKESLTSEKFNRLMDEALFPEKYKTADGSIFKQFDVFLRKRKLSENRMQSYQVVKRMLKRYELFRSIGNKKEFVLTFECITPELLDDFEDFIRNEHILYEEYPELYQAVPETRVPRQRGQNRIGDIFRRLRAFLIWANDTERTTNNPFKKYRIPEAVYGSPLYISIEERNQIYRTDLSHKPALAIQRDIFVFQCLVGCRVGDLVKLTAGSVVNGAIEYIPRKTKDGRPVTVRVPLNETAQEIIERYRKEKSNGKLLPFISEQNYNKAIKEIFTAAGITRIVTILNPTTREEEKRPINEIASSHMARRTFIGNLYKKVKDPNLVGSLSGHKEGSKSFARYREIDEDIRRELIKHLDI